MSDKSEKSAGIAKGSPRKDNEPPSVIAADGWRYHHLGIPTQTPRPGELHVPHLKIHVAGVESSPFGIQWMRFDEDAPYPEIIKTVPHVAFEVDDLAAALQPLECKVDARLPPHQPSPRREPVPDQRPQSF